MYECCDRPLSWPAGNPDTRREGDSERRHLYILTATEPLLIRDNTLNSILIQLEKWYFKWYEVHNVQIEMGKKWKCGYYRFVCYDYFLFMHLESETQISFILVFIKNMISLSVNFLH